MSAVTGVVKMGDLYILVSGMNIIGRSYVPRQCFSACQSGQAEGCPCHVVELINQLSLTGRVADIQECYDIYSCIRKLASR